MKQNLQNRKNMSKYYISAEKAYNIVDARSDQSVTLHFPYKIKFRKENHNISAIELIHQRDSNGLNYTYNIVYGR